MKKVLILRSQDIFSDSRVLKYESFLKKEEIPYMIVGWDRRQADLERENTFYYRRKAGFQQRTKGIVNRIYWNFYLLRFLFENINSYNVIHACDFDTVMPALIMKLFGKKIIFDIFDWFSDEVRTGRVLIDKTINILEKFAVKHSNLVILCEEGRLAQMKCTPRNYIVIPNIPVQLITRVVNGKKNRKNSHIKSIAITYVGGLVHSRGLIELLDCVKGNEKFCLEIAGFGDAKIEDEIKMAARKYDNIHYHGKVPYSVALEFMQKADLLYAMYYKKNFNHIYAAPNKFYESIFLKKPVITTEGTLVGKKVKQFSTGFVIEEGKEALEKFLVDIDREKIERLRAQMPQGDFFLEELHRNLEVYKSNII